MLAKFIGGFVVLLIGVSLLPTITQQITNAQGSLNVSSSAAEGAVSTATSLLGMVPFFFGVVIVMIAVAIAYSALKDVGLTGGDYDESEDEDTDEDTREQMGERQKSRSDSGTSAGQVLTSRRSSQPDTAQHIPEIKELEQHGEEYFKKSKFD